MVATSARAASRSLSLESVVRAHRAKESPLKLCAVAAWFSPFILISRVLALEGEFAGGEFFCWRRVLVCEFANSAINSSSNVCCVCFVCVCDKISAYVPASGRPWWSSSLHTLNFLAHQQPGPTGHVYIRPPAFYIIWKCFRRKIIYTSADFKLSFMVAGRKNAGRVWFLGTRRCVVSFPPHLRRSINFLPRNSHGNIPLWRRSPANLTPC